MKTLLLIAGILGAFLPETVLSLPVTFSGTLPAPLTSEVHSGQVFFFSTDDPSGWKLLKTASVPVQGNGDFSATVDSPVPEGNVRAEFYFPSKDFIPFTVYGDCPATQPTGTLANGLLISKKIAAHFTGTMVDGTNGAPIPWVEISRDSQGTHLARADQNGNFDFWSPVIGGQAQFNPYIGTYVGETFEMPAQSGGNYHFNIPLEEGVHLRVRTVDLDGKPVPGVAISFMGGGATGGWIGDSGEAVMGGKLSAYRPTHLNSIAKPGWVLAEDPGPIYSGFYVDKALLVRLKPVENAVAVNKEVESRPVADTEPTLMGSLLTLVVALGAACVVGLVLDAWFRPSILSLPQRLLACVVLIVLVGGTAWIYWEKNNGFTPWMSHPDLDRFLSQFDTDPPGQHPNYWDNGHWIDAVEARWRGGIPEYRIRYSATPKGYGITWYWYLDMDKEFYSRMVHQLNDKGFVLLDPNYYMRPDNSPRYQGVWHLATPQNPILEPPASK